MVVIEVPESGPSTSTLAIQLAEILDDVRALISEGVFYGASRVLMTMATHHPTLDFDAICGGYADRWSVEQIQALGRT